MKLEMEVMQAIEQNVAKEINNDVMSHAIIGIADVLISIGGGSSGMLASSRDQM